MAEAAAEPERAPAAGGLPDEEYGDIHKIVLQGLLSAGFLDTKGVKKLFIGACTYLKLSHTERTTMPYVQKVVREINEKVKPYDMAIKSASCEFTGKKYYIFLITVENPIFKFQTLFSKFELDLFQKCFEAILRKYNTFSVPPTECMHYHKDCENRGSLQEAENFIMRMIDTNYFAKYMLDKTEYNVTLGFRGIREFEPVLREVYPDIIASCSLCKMVLLHGLLCPNCKLLVHKHCYAKFIRTSKECPRCKISWAEGDPAEPIEMIRRCRDVTNAAENLRTPPSQESQQASGEDGEEEASGAANEQEGENAEEEAEGEGSEGNEDQEQEEDDDEEQEAEESENEEQNKDDSNRELNTPPPPELESEAEPGPSRRRTRASRRRGLILSESDSN